MRPSEELMNYKDLAELLKLSLVHTRRITKKPGFPAPTYPTGNLKTPRWLTSEVREWVKNQRAKAS